MTSNHSSTAERRERIAEAKRLLRQKLLQHPNPDVRVMAGIAEPADDHPAVVAIADALLTGAPINGN